MALVRLLRRSMELSTFNSTSLEMNSQSLEQHVIKSLLAVPFLRINVTESIRDKFDEYDERGLVKIFTQRYYHTVISQFHYAL